MLKSLMFAESQERRSAIDNNDGETGIVDRGGPRGDLRDLGIAR